MIRFVISIPQVFLWRTTYILNTVVFVWVFSWSTTWLLHTKSFSMITTTHIAFTTRIPYTYVWMAWVPSHMEFTACFAPAWEWRPAGSIGGPAAREDTSCYTAHHYHRRSFSAARTVSYFIKKSYVIDDVLHEYKYTRTVSYLVWNTCECVRAVVLTLTNT